MFPDPGPRLWNKNEADEVTLRQEIKCPVRHARTKRKNTRQLGPTVREFRQRCEENVSKKEARMGALCKFKGVVPGNVLLIEIIL